MENCINQYLEVFLQVIKNIFLSSRCFSLFSSAASRENKFYFYSSGAFIITEIQEKSLLIGTIQISDEQEGRPALEASRPDSADYDYQTKYRELFTVKCKMQSFISLQQKRYWKKPKAWHFANNLIHKISIIFAEQHRDTERGRKYSRIKRPRSPIDVTD